VLEDHDLVRGRFQEGVLSRLDRVGVANLAAGLDAVCAQLFEQAPEPGLRLPSRLVDVTQGVPQSVRLYGRNDHPQLQLIGAVAVAADLAHRLGAERVAGDHCEQPPRHRASARSRSIEVAYPSANR
jgi:hypothetical protein